MQCVQGYVTTTVVFVHPFPDQQRHACFLDPSTAALRLPTFLVIFETKVGGQHAAEISSTETLPGRLLGEKLFAFGLAIPKTLQNTSGLSSAVLFSKLCPTQTPLITKQSLPFTHFCTRKCRRPRSSTRFPFPPPEVGQCKRSFFSPAT